MADLAKRWVPRAGILVLVGFALHGIGDATNRWFALAGLAVIGLALWPRSWPRLDIAFLRLLGAVAVATLAVIGANVLASSVDELFGGSGEHRLPILWGMAAAMLIFGAVVYLYARRIGGWSRRLAGVGATLLAIVVIAGLPILADVLSKHKDPVPESEPVASQLDLLIVTDGSRHPASPGLPPIPTTASFDVSYSVGVADGKGVRWTLANDPDTEAALRAVAAGGDLPPAPELPVPRKETHAALLLLVDGTPPVALNPSGLPEATATPGEVARWSGVAADALAVAPPGTPVFAVLQTTDRGRLERWRRVSRLDAAISAQAQGQQTVAETGLQLAIGSSTSLEDFSLAVEHRPVLLFDRAEPFPVPLSVNSLFDEERVTLCDDHGVSTECGEEPLLDPRELRSGGTHLRLDLREVSGLSTRAERDRAGASAPLPPGGPGTLPPGAPPPRSGPPTAPPGRGSAIYVHPVSVDRGRKHLLYLDYWWYLPGNPVEVGGGALCGAGLVIPGITCQSHESDWEGLTVVLDRTEAKPRILAVHYAQHDSVVRYSWQRLRERWRASDVTRVLPPVADLAGRPLAFVARGTHASYPEPCPSGCKQVATGFGEGLRRGDLGWAGNDTGECDRLICVQSLPTTDSGEKAALWNAYTGQWGERHCRFTFYCDSGSPPTAPGNQGRYEDPTQYDMEKVPRPPQG